MDSCEAVDKELQRVIAKFSGVHEHSKRLLGDVTNNFEDLRSTLAEGKFLNGHMNGLRCTVLGLFVMPLAQPLMANGTL